jgi:hypothetical protein
MRLKHLLATLALAAIAIGCTLQGALAGTTWPVAPGFIPQPTFQSQADLFRYVAVDRRLGDPWDSQLLEQLQADSHASHLSDPAAGPITVVQIDLRNADGTSRARSPDGNYAYYVLRDSPHGMALLGRMFGQRYTSRVEGDHLEFEVELHRSATQVVAMHFRVEDSTLLNLSSPPPGKMDLIAG